VQGAGCRAQGAGCRVQGAAGCRVQGAGCRVQGVGCRLPGSTSIVLEFSTVATGMAGGQEYSIF
jgi:hypothetical protein